MHPAFSVIFFTTVSGLGYGLMGWSLLSLLLFRAQALNGVAPALHLFCLGLAAVLVSAGLLSSLGHLGKPQRAWRAFSQWRSSWLSREGVLAVAGFVPLLVLGWSLTARWRGVDGSALDAAGTVAAVAALLLAMATVACTAMIYASLKPIPAWRHALVVPVYLLFATYTGLLAWAAIMGVVGEAIPPVLFAAMILAVLLALAKLIYWRAIRRPLPVGRSSALGLPADRTATVFERPHTEANYLTTEMGFVLARKHAGRLRVIAVALFAALPLAGLALAAWLPASQSLVLPAVAVLALLGAMVERWLFFAEAKHLVTLYY